MSRILIRAHKSPFTVASAEETNNKNLIGDNAGNLVFSQSIYRLLSTQDAELATARLRTDVADEINDEFDTVVIPLANAFRRNFKDPLNAMSDIIEKLNIPVVVAGVGAQASLGGRGKHDDDIAPSVKRFVSAVLDRSPSIGVRGQFTKDYLDGLGFGDEHVEVIGCPSMFMNGPNLEVTKKVEKITPDSRLALNISPYVRRMGPITVHHAQRYPNLRYMAQDHRSLELMLWGEYPDTRYTRTFTRDIPLDLRHQLIRENRTRFFLDPITWINHLATYEFSFGTRIHGNITALLAGTPAVVLAHDSRTLELADYHQIPLRLINKLPADIDAAALYAEADWQPMVDGHGERWERLSAFLAKHGLRHVYEAGESPDDFDRRLAAITFPRPVETFPYDVEQMLEMKRDLRKLKNTERVLVTPSTLTRVRNRLARRRNKPKNP